MHEYKENRWFLDGLLLYTVKWKSGWGWENDLMIRVDGHHSENIDRLAALAVKILDYLNQGKPA